MKELCTCGGRRVFGELILPEGKDRAPLIIFAHELGQCHLSTEGYARRMAETGYACVIFDFCGGTEPKLPNESDPNPHMSVISERDEIIALVEAAKGFEGVDPDKIILCGASQGGMASTLAAAELGDRIKALALMYPALCIRDDMHRTFGSLDSVGDRFELWGGYMNLSKRYLEDVWELDVYEKIPTIGVPVLLMHGDSDELVNVSYSERAAELFGDREFHVISGAGHGFGGEQYEQAADYLKAFCDRVLG